MEKKFPPVSDIDLFCSILTMFARNSVKTWCAIAVIQTVGAFNSVLTGIRFFHFGRFKILPDKCRIDLSQVLTAKSALTKNVQVHLLFNFLLLLQNIQNVLAGSTYFRVYEYVPVILKYLTIQDSVCEQIISFLLYLFPKPNGDDRPGTVSTIHSQCSFSFQINNQPLSHKQFAKLSRTLGAVLSFVSGKAAAVVAV